MRSDAGGRTRVVMMVANPFTHDTRVEKEARTLVEAGLDVHVIAFLRTGLAQRETRDGFTVHRIKVGLSYWPGLAVLVFAAADRLALLYRLLPPEDPAAKGNSRLARGLVTFARGVAVALLVFAFFLRYVLRWTCGRLGLRWRPVRRRIVLARAAVRRRWRRVRRRIVLGRAALRRRWRPLRRRLVLARAAARRRRVARRGRGLAARAMRAVGGRLRLGGPNASVTLLAVRRRFSFSGRILNANRDFARMALSLQPQIVHAHDLNTLPAGLIVKALAGTRLVYDSHELFLDRNIGSNWRALDRKIWGPIERHGINRCDDVISVSKGICRTLEQRYGVERVHLVRNVQRYEPPPAKRRALLHEALRLEPGTRIGIYAGGIIRHRGLETMIDCSPHLRSTVFVIMGYAHDQAYLASLERRASELGMLGSKLFFHPAVPTNEVINYVAGADVGMVPTENVCLSYYFEASNKIFHCMMAGVPLAMSDHPEKRMLVEQYGVGIVFAETRPPAEIANAVESFLDDRASYAMAQRACVKAARVLNWEHEEQTLRRIYTRLGAAPNGLPLPRRADAAVISGQASQRPHASVHGGGIPETET